MEKIKVSALLTYSILALAFIIAIFGYENIELLYLSVLMICLSVTFGIITSILILREICKGGQHGKM